MEGNGNQEWNSLLSRLSNLPPPTPKRLLQLPVSLWALLASAWLSKPSNLVLLPDALQAVTQQLHTELVLEPTDKACLPLEKFTFGEASYYNSL